MTAEWKHLGFAGKLDEIRPRGNAGRPRTATRTPGRGV
jgi:hypothetical protein